MTHIDVVSGQTPPPDLPRSTQRAAVTTAPVARGATPHAAQTAQAVTPAQPQEEGQPTSPNPDTVREMVERANRRLTEEFNTHMRFRVDDTTEKLVVQVIDGQTDEVVRQFPPEEVLSRLQAMEDLKGVIYQGVG